MCETGYLRKSKLDHDKVYDFWVNSEENLIPERALRIDCIDSFIRQTFMEHLLYTEQCEGPETMVSAKSGSMYKMLQWAEHRGGRDPFCPRYVREGRASQDGFLQEMTVELGLEPHQRMGRKATPERGNGRSKCLEVSGKPNEASELPGSRQGIQEGIQEGQTRVLRTEAVLEGRLRAKLEKTGGNFRTLRLLAQR